MRGITFDEASNALFIRKRVIGAIGAGDWDNLPHPVYVKGYVRQHAIFLNMLDLLKSEAASGEDESPVQGPEAFPSFHSQDAGSNRPDCCEETPNVLGRETQGQEPRLEVQ
jgi:cytoskeletal protein RodZ